MNRYEDSWKLTCITELITEYRHNWRNSLKKCQKTGNHFSYGNTRLILIFADMEVWTFHFLKIDVHTLVKIVFFYTKCRLLALFLIRWGTPITRGPLIVWSHCPEMTRSWGDATWALYSGTIQSRICCQYEIFMIYVIFTLELHAALEQPPDLVCYIILNFGV